MNPEVNGGGGLSPASGDAPRERPFTPAPERSAPASDPSPARAAEAPASSTGTDNKYVVWSSAPSDVPRTGPDDR